MNQAVIVSGGRTPFVRAFQEYTELDTIALGTQCVRGLVERSGIDPKIIDAVVWGGVILPPASPNIAREIVLDAALPSHIEAMTVSRACASSMSAFSVAVAMIERGEAEVVIAGGSDSTSNAAIPMPSSLMQKLGPTLMGGKSSPGGLLRAVSKLNIREDLLPLRPSVSERSTGESMGQGAEKMAVRNEITRLEQDEFALLSHQRAAAAWDSGFVEAEILPVQLGNGSKVERDTLIRKETTLEKLAKLRPAFSRTGTVTAGTSSPLTDGAAALLVMSRKRAEELGLKPLASMKSCAYVGVDPKDQLLIGPALAMPLALKRAGLNLSHIDVVDMHEAFAAQCLSVLKNLNSDAFAVERLGLSQAVGMISSERLNLYGGSLAYGHPFAATGARMIYSMARHLEQSGQRNALLGMCAAGGLGAALILENASS